MEHVTQKDETVATVIEIAIKLGILGVILYTSFLILKPFLVIIVWGIILAVALSPVVDGLVNRFGNRKKVIIAMMTTIFLTLLLPTFMLSGKIVKSGQALTHIVQDGNLTIPPPTKKVKTWPLIGEKTYSLWDSASKNLRQTLAPFSKQIQSGASSLLSIAGSVIGTIFIFFASLILAAAFLIGSESEVKLYQGISCRLIGKERGAEWAQLTALTVRSVVVGVLGVALIQSAFGLFGFVLMDIPFAPLLALAILFLAIIQVPVMLITIPVIIYVFSQGSGTAEIIFTIYMLFVGTVDNILKPLLMGRGVNIPMLVILIGAIGGMILMGMIGLFIGAVILALAYKLFGLWISNREDRPTNEASQKVILS